jgi:hypothetical protein
MERTPSQLKTNPTLTSTLVSSRWNLPTYRHCPPCRPARQLGAPLHQRFSGASIGTTRATLIVANWLTTHLGDIGHVASFAKNSQRGSFAL